MAAILRRTLAQRAPDTGAAVARRRWNGGVGALTVVAAGLIVTAFIIG